MSSLVTLALKSPNRIFICYLLAKIILTIYACSQMWLKYRDIKSVSLKYFTVYVLT
jgi:hypothetical protein